MKIILAKFLCLILILGAVSEINFVKADYACPNYLVDSTDALPNALKKKSYTNEIISYIYIKEQKKYVIETYHRNGNSGRCDIILCNQNGNIDKDINKSMKLMCYYDDIYAVAEKDYCLYKIDAKGGMTKLLKIPKDVYDIIDDINTPSTIVHDNFVFINERGIQAINFKNKKLYTIADSKKLDGTDIFNTVETEYSLHVLYYTKQLPKQKDEDVYLFNSDTGKTKHICRDIDTYSIDHSGNLYYKDVSGNNIRYIVSTGKIQDIPCNADYIQEYKGKLYGYKGVNVYQYSLVGKKVISKLIKSIGDKKQNYGIDGMDIEDNHIIITVYIGTEADIENMIFKSYCFDLKGNHLIIDDYWH